MKLHGQQEIRKNGLVTQTPQQTLKHMRLFHFSLELVCVNRRLQAFIFTSSSIAVADQYD